MNVFRTKGIEIRIVVCLLAFLMGSQSAAVLAGADRIVPTRQVTLYRGDKIVGVYTKEAPLPEGSIISTEGRCAVKLDDLYLVGEDRSVFSINTSDRQRNLFIKEGTVYFKTSAMRRPFSFITPYGPVSVQSIRLDAAFGDGSIKGYVAVTKGRSEVGVAEGGSMAVLTDNGLMTIQSGKKITLSQADMDIGLPEKEKPAAKQPPASEPGMSNGRKIAYGALGVVAIAGIAMGLGGGGGGGGGGGDTVSPSTP
ncbi:MAG: hypothetical protein KQI81_19050 [Deltaproteobacteria bacterium]|nr:hypothetical protein [Deltaproteobacteria bacterium]